MYFLTKFNFRHSKNYTWQLRANNKLGNVQKLLQKILF
jgi:hypothetical protein